MTIALIDADLVAYRCAASAEKNDADIAMIRASRLLTDIISITDASTVKLYLSGSTNFRKDVYPEYKANRDKLVRPTHLQPVREFLVKEWGAEVTDGYEADDALGIQAEGLPETVVCSLDKDLLQIPGLHYNFVSREFRDIGRLEGWFNFYSQLVLGDRSDNVPGYDGKMRPKFPKFLFQTRDALHRSTTAFEMYKIVKDLYLDQGILTRNAKLLYILRSEEEWQNVKK